MREAIVPEFEVRIFRTGQKSSGQKSGEEKFQTILIGASNEKAALPRAAQLAKEHGADFFLKYAVRFRSAGCGAIESR